MAEDRDWVAELSSDEPDAAIEALRRVLERGLTRAFAGRGADHTFIEDVVQESLVKIFKALDSFEGRSRFTTWAMAIANRAAISKFRKRKYREYSLDQISADGDLRVVVEEDSNDDVSRDTERQELLAQLRTLIDSQLTDRQRKVMQAALSGLPMEEIATRMDSNRNAIYKLFHDARKKLRQGFESLGVSAGDIRATI